MLDGLDDFGLVALDDADEWIGARQWEEALLHLFQQLSEARRDVAVWRPRVVRSNSNFRLADLASRLRASQCSRFDRSTTRIARKRSSNLPRSAASNSAPT